MAWSIRIAPAKIAIDAFHNLPQLTVLARNETDRDRGLTLQRFLASDLTWLLVSSENEDERWLPTFMPPPMPPLTGIPVDEYRVSSGAEVEIAKLWGINGFMREGSDPSEGWQAHLPVGSYAVHVAGFVLEEERLDAPPIELVIR